MTTSHLGEHAIVIGGSMAGVLAARALSDSFTRVTLIERDAMTNDSQPRKGVPQARHAHGLLTKGYDVMSAFFPGLAEGLVAKGALRADMGVTMRMYNFGGYKIPTESGMIGTVCTRGVLDWAVREELAKVPNIAVLANRRVEGLIFSSDNSRVMGVSAQALETGSEEVLSADLVVDTAGRGSQCPKWLELHGYERPQESIVSVNVGYSTRTYTRSVPDAEAHIYLILDTPPNKRLGVAFPIEGQRWIVTLTGTLGDHPPQEDAAALAFARSLPTSDIAEIMANEQPLDEPIAYRFPANQRRHYERMTRFPEGLLVMGDAVCSFNPIYGQGMTATAIEAEVLHAMITALDATLDGFAPRFFRAITKTVDAAWGMATGEDFRYAEVEGERPKELKFLHPYLEWVHHATQVDPTVYLAFLNVMNMQAPPTTLMAPGILFRILRHRFFGRRAASVAAARPAMATAGQ